MALKRAINSRIYTAKRSRLEHQRNKNQYCTEFYDNYTIEEKHIYSINQINYIEISPDIQHKHSIKTPIEDLIQVSSVSSGRSVVLKKSRLLHLLHKSRGNISIAFRLDYGF